MEVGLRKHHHPCHWYSPVPMTRWQWPNDPRLLLHLLLLSQRFRALLLACCQRLNGGLADETKNGLETMPPSCSLRQTDLAVAADMGPRPLPGAFENGTHLKYASNISRFSVNRYQPQLFVAKRKKRLKALRPACAFGHHSMQLLL